MVASDPIPANNARGVPLGSSLECSGDNSRSEYLLVGGGLQNSLITLAILHHQPGAKLTLVERNTRLGGQHTWCFHANDVPPAARAWLDPLVANRWLQYDVHFPDRRRRLDDEYCAVTSDRLHQVVSEKIAGSPHAHVVQGTVEQMDPNGAQLTDGTRLVAELVVDSRGPQPNAAGTSEAYQKFLGLEMEIEPGSACSVPMLMDAAVAQTDGFRFVYVLPFAPDRILVEDTYYSRSSKLDRATLRERVEQYAKSVGIVVRRVIREEAGVLPIPLRVQAMQCVPASSGRRANKPLTSALAAGYAGGFFHPTTGYSFPVATRLALHLASRSPHGVFDDTFDTLMRRHHRQVRYCLLLNRMLFGAFAPDERYRVLEHFYRLPAATIRRFYALEMTVTDRARILCGRPPQGLSLRGLFAEKDLP